jgi:hypothetical protein
MRRWVLLGLVAVSLAHWPSDDHTGASAGAASKRITLPGATPLADPVPAAHAEAAPTEQVVGAKLAASVAPVDSPSPSAPTTTAPKVTTTRPAPTSTSTPSTTTPTTARPTGATPLNLTPRPAPPGPLLGDGRQWRVSAAAAPGGDGSAERPFRTIAEGLAVAQAGDAVVVGPGTYRERVTTVRGGHPDAPLHLVGDGARLEGDGDGRLLQVLHSHVTVQGFDLSGADHLLWVQGAQGVRILQNHLSGAGGECMRLKYFSSGNEIAWNVIEDCGRRGFNVAAGKKNGEGIYIGTAPEQLDRNPTSAPDASNDNWVHDNVVSPRSECVDVKEAATGNRIEGNTCRGSQDPDGAGFSSRGRATVFSENISVDGAGAGIRLGGDAEGDGILSVVRRNRLTGNRGYGVKVQRQPQTLICGNDTTGNGQGPTNAPGDPSQPC